MLLQKCSVKNLERKFKSENNANIKARIQIILYLREGKTQREVSAELRISTGIVPYWKARFEKEGFEGLIDRKGRGRKTGVFNSYSGPKTAGKPGSNQTAARIRSGCSREKMEMEKMGGNRFINNHCFIYSLH